MPKDAQGHALSGATIEAAAHYDAGIRAFILAYGDAMGQLEAAREAAPGCAMAYLGKAWIQALSNDRSTVPAARDVIEAVRTLSLNEREQAHLISLSEAVSGNWSASVSVLDRHLMSYPHDILAHQVALRLDGFQGRFPLGAGRSARALPLWSKEQAGYGMLLSFYGFGLEETGDYAQAEVMSRTAAELEPYGYWPHHAVSHVLEMTGRPQEGLAWMASREPLWCRKSNTNQVHIHWHKALFHVELGQYAAALILYDEAILPTLRPVGTSLCNATALLWRLETLGTDVGKGRWTELSRLWQGRSGGSVFNDIHAGMTLLRAGEAKAFEDLQAAAMEVASSEVAQAAAYRAIGAPVLEALRAFESGAHARAVELLLPARFDVWRMGGSKAQRDLVDWTLTEAAVRGGMRDVALALANERLALRPESIPNQTFLARAEGLAAARREAW